MKFNVGDIIYDGGGNGLYYTFAKCKVIFVYKDLQYYECQVLEDYGSVWESGPPQIGRSINCLESLAFLTYDEAKSNLYKKCILLQIEILLNIILTVTNLHHVYSFLLKLF